MRYLYVVAEAQVARALRLAADALRREGIVPEASVRGFVASELQGLPGAALSAEVAACDVFIGSMLNSETEVQQLREALARRRPPVVAVFASQPELLALSRIPPFDAQDGQRLAAVAGALARAGLPVAAPAGLLAGAARLPSRVPVQALGELALYAQAAQYWLHASPQNLRGLLVLLARAHPRGRGLPEPEPPQLFPEVALWHPRADRLFTRLEEYRRWYARARPPAPFPRGRVGVVLFRQYITTQAAAHYAAVIEALEKEGLEVVPGFAGLDGSRLATEFFAPAGCELVLNLAGFNLVGSMGRPRPEAATGLLRELDVPYLVALPLLFQSLEEWERDPVGLSPMQTALQVVLPELEGGIEPRVFAGRAADDGFEPHPEQVRRLARRCRRWVELRRKPPAERRVAITLYRFPPDRGSIGSAAYLDVFASLHRLLRGLQDAGYRVEGLPASPQELCRALVDEDGAGADGRGAVAGRLPVEDYRRRVPEHGRIGRVWGAAPGQIDTDGRALRVRGRRFGHVFVGIQPGFGYEGDPLRLLFAPDASPSHSFAAYYAWVREGFGADVLLHFGTHGALEFMPGKQVGLTPGCYPDALLGDLPHLYLYSLNNPSEATIAKRRAGATVVTHLTPPLREAGLYRQLAALKDAALDYRTAQGELRLRAAWDALRELALAADLDADVPPPRDAEPRSRRDYVDRLGAYLQELEHRLIPSGLHVLGRAPSPEAAVDFLAAVLRHARPEAGVPPLDRLCRDAGLDPESGPRRVCELLAQGRAGEAKDLLGAPAGWEALAAFAEDFLGRLRGGQEEEALLAGLAGRYIPPQPGGDPARAPEALPTGRNLHALDPHRIPSPAARRAGAQAMDALLARLKGRLGRWPEAVAFVLWGTDNIKTHGEGVAQVLHLLGVEPCEDSLGRLTRLRLIPLAELGRPRIDTVLTVSGIFRDIFPSVAELLDRAVRLAAEAPEGPEENFVRKHVLALAGELGLDPDEAAARVFSNAPGHYGSGVNHVVDASSWRAAEELGEVFVSRKAFAFGRGLAGRPSPELLAACLARCEATFQNVDSAEIGLADVDHYYEYLGGLTAAVRQAAGRQVPALVQDVLAPREQVRPLEEALRVELRTRLLNPRWYEAMLAHGYQGVHEVAVRLENAFGWSATAGAVEGWVYQQAARTFLLDEDMRRRLAGENARALQRMAQRLAEARGRGFWSPAAEEWSRFSAICEELEDVVEGIA